MMSRVFERIAPSVVLLRLTVGVVTFTGGLHMAAFFLLGVAVYASGRFLDNYGLESRL